MGFQGGDAAVLCGRPLLMILKMELSHLILSQPFQRLGSDSPCTYGLGPRTWRPRSIASPEPR